MLSPAVRAAADNYAASQGAVPDGTLLFAKLAEAYEAGYQAAAPAAGASPVGGAGEGAAGALVNDAERKYLQEVYECLPASMADFLHDFHGRLTPAATPSLLGGGAATDEWVSVKERLPKRVTNDGTPTWYSEYVLLHLGFHKLPVVGYYDYRDGYKCFQCEDRNEEFPMPTHWRELPAAPTQVAIEGSGSREWRGI